MVDGKKVAVCPRSEQASNVEKWSKSLVGYVVGRRPYFVHLKQRMERQWKPKGSLEVFSRSNGLFYFKFGEKTDCDRILEEGPWYFEGRLVVLKKWKQGMSNERDMFDKMPVWLRLPDLPVEWWSLESISRIASIIGNPLYVDGPTGKGDRIAYARCCVEVGLGEDLPHSVNLRAEEEDAEIITQAVTYDWRPSECPHCHTFGHSEAQCSMVKASKPLEKRSKTAWQAKATAKSKATAGGIIPRAAYDTHSDPPATLEKGKQIQISAKNVQVSNSKGKLLADSMKEGEADLEMIAISQVEGASTSKPGSRFTHVRKGELEVDASSQVKKDGISIPSGSRFSPLQDADATAQAEGYTDADATAQAEALSGRIQNDKEMEIAVHAEHGASPHAEISALASHVNLAHAAAFMHDELKNRVAENAEMKTTEGNRADGQGEQHITAGKLAPAHAIESNAKEKLITAYPPVHAEIQHLEESLPLKHTGKNVTEGNRMNTHIEHMPTGGNKVLDMKETQPGVGVEQNTLERPLKGASFSVNQKHILWRKLKCNIGMTSDWANRVIKLFEEEDPEDSDEDDPAVQNSSEDLLKGKDDANLLSAKQKSSIRRKLKCNFEFEPGEISRFLELLEEDELEAFDEADSSYGAAPNIGEESPSKALPKPEGMDAALNVIAVDQLVEDSISPELATLPKVPNSTANTYADLRSMPEGIFSSAMEEAAIDSLEPEMEEDEEEEEEELTGKDSRYSAVSPIMSSFPRNACVANPVYAASVEEESSVPKARNRDRQKEKENLRGKFGAPAKGKSAKVFSEGISTRSRGKATVNLPLDRLRP